MSEGDTSGSYYNKPNIIDMEPVEFLGELYSGLEVKVIAYYVKAENDLFDSEWLLIASKDIDGYCGWIDAQYLTIVQDADGYYPSSEP